MRESLKVPTYPVSTANRNNTWLDFAEASSLPQTLPDLQALPDLNVTADLATCLYTCIRLDWEDLKCFEVVNHQFQQWGVTFANAVALRPSNPAYPPYSGVMVLMGAPKDGWLETTFSRPVQFVSGFITSSRRTVLTAFDHRDRVVGRVESGGANLADSESSTNAKALHSDYSHPGALKAISQKKFNAQTPNVQLRVNAPNIHRVTFHTFNGHLTLDDFSFGF